MIVRIRRILLLATMALAPACVDPGTEPPISDETFVDVMVALRRAAITHAEDVAAFEAEKTAILEAAQVTDSTLQRFVRTRAREPQELSELFSAIRDSLRPALDTGLARPSTDPGSMQ